MSPDSASVTALPNARASSRPADTAVQKYENVHDNPAWLIASRLPPQLPGVRLVVPPEALRSAYHALLDAVPQLLRAHRPDVALHIGRAADQAYFSLERSAPRDGYHQVPDVDRRVFTKAETKACWGRAPAALATALDLDAVLAAWRRHLGATKGSAGKKGKPSLPQQGAAPPDVRVTDDVGTFVCGFAYYASLAEMAKREDGAARRAVFLHVPPLETEAEMEMGREVVVALVKALAEV